MDHSGQATHAEAAPQSESLLDILKRRCALGEITLLQFEEMKRVLGVQEEVMAASGGRDHPHR